MKIYYCDDITLDTNKLFEKNWRSF